MADIFTLIDEYKGLLDEKDRLKDATTENNKILPLDAVTPVLILDMWEHAYLPVQHFDKAAYVDTWFSLIDWDVAEQRYLDALSGKAVG